MDTNQFDRLTIAVSRHVSRRSALRGLGATLAGIVAVALGREETEAAPYSIPLGGVCYRDLQCRNDFIPTRRRQLPPLQVVHCADNGFSRYDGRFNCCRNDGGTCYADGDCCGTRSCVRQFCRYIKGKRNRRHHRRRPHHHGRG